MTNVALRLNKLGKQYRLGDKRRPEHIIDSVTNIFKRKKQNDVIWAVKDVSLEIERGDIIGFVGANGAGKSTLLKILARVTKPTTGTAEVFGRVGSMLEVGSGFHPELTGRENIFLNGSVLGMIRKQINSKFDEIVEFSGVGNQIDLPVKFYSSGQYTRLGFAVAAHLDSEILIVDEGLSVGDAEFQEKGHKKMKELTENGRTVLFVSHQKKVLLDLCTKAVWLNKGQLVEIGPPESLVANYYASATPQNSL